MKLSVIPRSILPLTSFLPVTLTFFFSIHLLLISSVMSSSWTLDPLSYSSSSREFRKRSFLGLNSLKTTFATGVSGIFMRTFEIVWCMTVVRDILLTVVWDEIAGKTEPKQGICQGRLWDDKAILFHRSCVMFKVYSHDQTTFYSM